MAGTARARHMAEFAKSTYPAYSRRATQVCILSQALEQIAAGEGEAANIAKAALEKANPFDWKGRSARKASAAVEQGATLGTN